MALFRGVIGHEAGIGWAQSWPRSRRSAGDDAGAALRRLHGPAIVAGLIIVAALLIGYLGGELRETTKRLRHPSRRERWRAALATVPNTLAGGGLAGVCRTSR